MDRKAWIVIILCSIGIVINAWFASQQVPPAAPAPAAVATLDKAPEAKAAAIPAPTAAVSTSAQPEETHTLTRGSVTWHFSSKGAGIVKVVLAGTDQITLNAHGHEPIGALRREATGNDAISYKVTAKTDQNITFEGVSADGITIRKTYNLTEGEGSDDHLISLNLNFINTGSATHKSEEYYLYAGAANSMSPDEALKPSFFWNDAGDSAQKDTNAFAGGWFSKEQMEMRSAHAHLRFGGVMSRFYTTIVSHISKGDSMGKPGKIWARRFLVDHRKDAFVGKSGADKDHAMEAAIGLPPVEINAGASHTETYEIYAGPKEYHRLKLLGKQREDVMFYGMWGFISRMLTNVMRWMHDVSGNWGVAIILLTLCIRTVLWPLQSKSQSSMKRMGLLAPMMKELQEKYKDDPQKQQMEVMKLYKDYGVNPIGGCFPMLLQIPIFFGFYSVLQNAAELRGQPWLWVKDLSLPDTVMQLAGYDINPLPLIMGVTMILQMKLTPQPATVDKTQKMMFTIMPFFFLFICYNFAAALSLYWSTQNIFAIFQSWVMKLYMKDPVLVKREHMPKGPAPVNPFFNPMNPHHKEKKTKPRSPKLGG